PLKAPVISQIQLRNAAIIVLLRVVPNQFSSFLHGIGFHRLRVSHDRQGHEHDPNEYPNAFVEHSLAPSIPATTQLPTDIRLQPTRIGSDRPIPIRAPGLSICDGSCSRQYQRFLPLSACLSNGTTSAPSSGSWPSPWRSRSRRSSSSRKSATSSNER